MSDISLFPERNFLQPQNTYSKEREKISAFLNSSPYRHWVAVWVIDWLTETGLLSWLLTHWHGLTDWLTETGLLSWLLTDWLKLGYCLDNFLTDWLKLGCCLDNWLTDWNCVAVWIIDRLTDWLKGLVSKEIVVLCQWGNETQKFGMILNSVFHSSPRSIC